MTIPLHYPEAVRNDSGTGFKALYTAPGIGCVTVKDKCGQPRIYATAEKAEQAASRAMCAALNFGPAPKLGRVVCRVVGSGRSRVLVSMGARR